MLSGASEADAAVLVVDVAEGVSEQTHRHAQLLQMLGLRQLVVVINKMDSAAYSRERFDLVAANCQELLSSLSLSANAVIPISARNGENIVNRSPNMSWYEGLTLADALAEFAPINPSVDAPLRMRVQDVYREGTMRVAVGRVESGSVSVGDTVLLSPMGSTTTVRSIERWSSPPNTTAVAGASIGLTFGDPVFVNRGDLVSHVQLAPSMEYVFHTACFWLDESPPRVGEQLAVHFGATTVRAVVSAIEGATDSATLERLSVDRISRYAIVQLKLRSSTLVALDDHASMPLAARLVLLRGRDVVGGGVVSEAIPGRTERALFPESHLLTTAERERRNGHQGMVLWLTGLSGSGKSTLAMGLERRLFQRGASVYVLDGDNVRRGLSSDLSFSADDRAENIRRVGEVAALFADAGLIVITAFISPMERDREIARAAGSGERFHEVYLHADLETCEARDTKGLYKRARDGEIPDFTGVSAPYEAPLTAQLVLDTAGLSVDDCLDRLVQYVDTATALRQGPPIPTTAR